MCIVTIEALDDSVFAFLGYHITAEEGFFVRAEAVGEM